MPIAHNIFQLIWLNFPFLLEVGDVSLHPLILCATFTLLVQTEAMNTSVQPIEYILKLNLDIKKKLFLGDVIIFIKVLEKTQTLDIHAADLELHEVSFVCEDGVCSCTFSDVDIENEFRSLWFVPPLSASYASLRLKFSGTIGESQHGVFFIPTVNGPIVAARCESTSARYVFPCFDDVTFKAPITLTLTFSDGNIAFSNMLPFKVTKHEGMKSVLFMTTPAIPTYLFSFVIGKFHLCPRVKSKAKGSIVKVFKPHTDTYNMEFLYQVATKVLNFLSDYLCMSYPYGRCCIVVVPGLEKAVCATSLIMLPEQSVLYSSKYSSLKAKYKVIYSIAYQLCLIWFGNYLTENSWNDLYVNRGIASFLKYLSVKELIGESDIWKHFTAFCQNEVLDTDSSDDAFRRHVGRKAIMVERQWLKMACILRMLYGYIGPENLQRMVQMYISSYSTSSLPHETFCKVMKSLPVNFDVDHFYRSWFECFGYPIILFDFIGDGYCALSMEQYTFIDTRAAPNWKLDIEDEEPTWCLPTRIIASNSEEDCLNLVICERLTEVSNRADLLKLNYQCEGLYRVKYGDRMFGKLCHAIKSNQLLPLDRFDLCRNYLALIRSGYISFQDFFELLCCFTEEDDYYVMAEVDKGFTFIRDLMERRGRENLERFDNFCAKFWTRYLTKFGWVDDDALSPNDRKLRSLAVLRLGEMGNQEVLEMTSKLFEKYHSTMEFENVELRGTILALTALKDDNCYAKLLDIYNNAKFPDAKQECLYAMGRNSQFRLTAITFALNDEIPLRNFIEFYNGLMSTYSGQRFAYISLTNALLWNKLDKFDMLAHVKILRIIFSRNTTPHFQEYVRKHILITTRRFPYLLMANSVMLRYRAACRWKTWGKELAGVVEWLADNVP
ncbi:Puromycin-sensitive aminopeptidase [Trichinella zimbabwensis]|uniref:Puromycin-sensitive aminopeptidase n=1 Tax=Trichinella zimbabwensis TaxID=268475 RepID=A0A0V1H4T1_9BILA|nr:Puromycin-sensitive aminopeptidase [Trichinella zimbabwensis]